jgi:hypothetical protein
VSATAVALPLPAVPPEVDAFAAEQGVRAYLPAVLDLARRLFPREPITLHLEDDPEIEDYRKIVLEVPTAGWDVPELVAAQNRWSQEIFHICPATHVLVFLLRMV